MVQETIRELKYTIATLKDKNKVLENDNYNLDMNLSHVTAEFDDCRNELCQLCGRYKTAHLGSCNGCRWNREESNG